jgi:hypothetical protein
MYDHIQKIKKDNPELINIGKYWSKSDENKLLSMIKNNSIEDIARFFLRTEGGIISRIRLIALSLIKTGKNIEEVSDITNLPVCDILSYIEKEDNKNKNKQNDKQNDKQNNNDNRKDRKAVLDEIYQLLSIVNAKLDLVREMEKDQDIDSSAYVIDF